MLTIWENACSEYFNHGFFPLWDYLIHEVASGNITHKDVLLLAENVMDTNAI